MKRIKTLDGIGKTEKQYKKQAKNWFSMNPNRKVINMKTNSGIIFLTRDDVKEY
jgi:hypothetical protein